jgi:hypothetical protein
MHKRPRRKRSRRCTTLSAVDLIAGYRAKQFSPSEVLEDVLAHIAAWEPHIKALYRFDPDGARATAKASTERWQKGEPIGRSTACRSRSRTISPPRASRCRWAPQRKARAGAAEDARRRRDCAKRAR